MKRVRLENIEIDLKERLRNEEFKRLYEIECAKIAIAKRKNDVCSPCIFDG